VRRLILLVALAGCYERGGARPREDAGVAIADAGVVGRWHADPPRARAQDGATIAIALEAEPASLDPLVAADAISKRVLADVVEGLVCEGERIGDEPHACLAARWRVDLDGRRWTFELAPRTFHDGTPVRSADVAASYARARDGWLAGDLDDVVAIETPDERTVVITFDRARGDRLVRLAHVPVLPGGAVPASGLPVGTGPLRIVAWRRGDAIELAGQGAVARVVYEIAADRAHALRMLGAGEVDLVVQVPVAEALDFAKANDGVGAFTYRLPSYLAAIYNARRPALASVEQRRAITALLDREGIAARLLRTHTITGPFPEDDPGTDPTIAPVPFDRALAARLLRGAERPHLQILVPQGSTTMAKVADIWASDARGIAELEVVTLPFGDLLARLAAGDFDVALLSMSTGPDLDLTSRLSSTAPREEAWCGLADRELDRLLQLARDAPEGPARMDTRRALHRRIAELAPMAFIAPDVRLGLARDAIGGVGGRGDRTMPRASTLWKVP
jgi:peptide/nickel transport system substrate-binding protein